MATLEQEQVAEEVQDQPDEAQVALETRAKGMGWIPEDQFRGDKARFTPADVYVERADNLMPIMKTTMKKYEGTIDGLKTQVTTLESSLKTQQETTEKLLKMSNNIKEQAYLQAKKDIQAQQVTAIKDGDIKSYQALEDKKDGLVKPEPDKVVVPQATQSPATGNPEYVAWLPNNQWYTTDKDLEIFADGIANEYKRDQPSLPFAQVLEAITTRTKAAFPHKFTNQARDTASVVDSSTERTIVTSSGNGAKTFSHLPADAKAQCDAFIADGTIKDRASYVKDYPFE